MMSAKKSFSFLRWGMGAFGLSLFLASCSSPQKMQSPILTGLQELTKFTLAPQTKAIVIVSDKSCSECNKRLSKVLVNYLHREDIQFVVSARESVLDLSQYLNAPRKDIVFDRNDRLSDQGVVKGSTILFLKDQKVDTTMQIDARQIDGQFAFLKENL